ncbi:SusC/RagA family TonB-linked outer membrane protein [Halalkalibaculum sp. DA384]|uniref:SusC/RagA family TonB-linked outer membrane protein n=1 Tax=Halalkalibaculum sp. DA384 TaxID=3373606 RepID=UPI0037541995
MIRYLYKMWKVLALLPLFLCQFSYGALAQGTVTGSVVDANSGENLPGVNVVVKGTTIGTSTNSEGNYELSVPSLQDTLAFSFVGYQTLEVPINGRSELNVELQSEAVIGEELLVVGYGTQRKSDLTGSVSSLGGESIENVPVTSVDNAIKGRVAGVYVKQTSSAPGGGTSVRIRGTNSLNAGSEPLYVIDGFPIYPDNSSEGTGSGRPPTNVLATLNLNNIESIEVLKDASATAIYGSRGASGVVIITTKKGQAGDTRVTYNGSQSFQTIANSVEMLPADGYARYRNILAESQGGAPLYSQQEIENMGAGTDWLDEISRTGLVADHQLSVSGGNESNRYAIVTSLHNNKGIVRDTQFKRYGLRLNLDNDLFKDIVTLNSSWSYTRGESENALTSQGPGGIIVSALQLDPTPEVRNENGAYNFPLYDDRFPINPVAELEDGVDEDRYNRFFGNSSLTVDILEGLSLTSRFGANIVFNERDTFFPLTTNIGIDQNVVLSKGQRSINNILNENTLSYTKQLTEDHSIDAVVGYTWQEEVNRFSEVENRDFPADNFKSVNLQNGINPQIPVSSRQQWNLQSFLARINYNFSDRYLATFTFRRDGSSKFGENNKWANFPSVALGWRINNEPFFENAGLADLFSNFKIRASWGVTGNSELPVYQSLSGLTTANYVIGGQLASGLVENRIPNPNLRWEETTMRNIALDLGFLNGRLDLTFEYFDNITDDLLLNVNIPSSTGFGSMLQNTGSMGNTGFEISTDYLAISRSDLRLNFSGNISIVENEITDLGGTQPFFTGCPGCGHLGVFGSWVSEGLPVGVWRGFDYVGIFQSEEEIQNSASLSGDLPGYPQYRDVNGDGRITPEGDMVIIGDPNPDFTWGLNSSLNVKQFDLSIYVRGVHGNEVRNLQQAEAGDGIQKINQISNILEDSWRPDNTDASRPIIDAKREFANYFRDSDFFIEDGSYLRVQNVTLGYTLPTSLTGQNVLQRARIYVSAQNLLTLTDYSGFDPEVSSGGQSNFNRGDDYDSYPRSRVFTIGLNLNF